MLVGLHVLVVEDNADARDLFRTILEYAGGLVSVAPDAKQALLLCQHIVPDVLVADIVMPEHDGFWLLQQLRAAGGRTAAIPAVAVTGQAEGTGRFAAAGFATHLRKPVDPWELCRIVAHLGRRR
ncbi:MAG TPA: response regulator [Methylomirabilota bacterium]|nr:response regulator [Methylomirabilota bacterium]